LRVASARAFDSGAVYEEIPDAALLMGDVHTHYDYGLVALSVLIAVAASYCALDLAGRMNASIGRNRWFWLAGGAAAVGAGIWSMHYVGIAALRLAAPVRHSVFSALVSLLAAISVAALALWVISQCKLAVGSRIGGSVGMGVGIAIMHYATTASMRMPVRASYHLAVGAASLAIAVAISWVALWCAFRLRASDAAQWSWRRLRSALVLGATMWISHHAAMAALRLSAIEHASEIAGGTHSMAVGLCATVLCTFMVLAVAVSASVLDRHYSARAITLQAATTHYQQFLRQVIDTNPHLIFVKDWGGKYVLANEAVAELYGTKVEHLLGKCDADFNPKSDEVDKFLRDDREVMSSQRAAFIAEEPATNARTGEIRWFETVKVPLLSSDGSTRQVLGVATDITDRKNLEEQFRQAHKMEAVGRLAGGVAHDFNNVLTIIRAQTEFLLADLDPNDHRRGDVLEIQGAADRAAAFTRQLLAFSRRQLLQPEVLELNTVIAGMEMMVRRLVGEDVVLLTKLHPDLPRISADPSQLQQVLLNLAVNARDAMPRGGTLLIETALVELDEYYPRQHPTAKPGPHVVLAVTDTGCGMDSATRIRIFEPFFTTKEPGKGTGLGLSTVYGIVKQSGGHIWVYSEPGRGTTFKLYFPPHSGAVKASEPERQVAPLNGSGATILLVEDERPVRSTVRRLLERHGYSVLEAANGQDALGLVTARRNEINLVLSDMVMPGMGGMELADRVRALSAGIPVVLMTGYTEEAITRAGERPHDEQIIEKPFTQNAMLEKVRWALAGPRNGSASGDSQGGPEDSRD
jgi:PAS domain S-box-containing protein